MGEIVIMKLCTCFQRSIIPTGVLRHGQGGRDRGGQRAIFPREHTISNYSVSNPDRLTHTPVSWQKSFAILRTLPFTYMAARDDITYDTRDRPSDGCRTTTIFLSTGLSTLSRMQQSNAALSHNN